MDTPYHAAKFFTHKELHMLDETKVLVIGVVFVMSVLGGIHLQRKNMRANFRQELEKLRQKNHRFNEIMQAISLDWEPRVVQVLHADDYDQRGLYEQLRLQGYELYKDLEETLQCDMPPLLKDRIEILTTTQPWIERYFAVIKDHYKAGENVDKQIHTK